MSGCRIDVGARLRAADPVSGDSRADAPADVFARITSDPRERRARQARRFALRRPLLVAVLALACGVGLAIAGTISVRYFDESDAKVVPAPVRNALITASQHYGPRGRLAVDQTILGYAFSSSSGSGRVYMTPYADQSGFCAALAVTGKRVQVSCTPGSPVRPSTVTLGPFQPWSVALAPDMHAMLGRLAPSDESESVVLAFEDGTTQTLPRLGRWFAYAVAGTRTTAGHRPVELRFERHGKVVRRSTLLPASFNTLAAARALVPKSDGSPAQNAIRAMLLANLATQLGDGGFLASHTELSATARVTSVRLAPDLRITLYATPLTPIAPYAPQGGSLLVGLDGTSPRPVLTFSGIGMPRRSTFESPFWCDCDAPHHPKTQFSVLSAAVPLRVTRIDVRTADGRLHPAVIFQGGRQWVWISRYTRTTRPVSLVGRDAAGAVIARRALHAP